MSTRTVIEVTLPLSVRKTVSLTIVKSNTFKFTVRCLLRTRVETVSRELLGKVVVNLVVERVVVVRGRVVVVVRGRVVVVVRGRVVVVVRGRVVVVVRGRVVVVVTGL